MRLGRGKEKRKEEEGRREEEKEWEENYKLPKCQAEGRGFPKQHGHHTMPLCLDIRYGSTRFNICPVGFQSYFNPSSLLRSYTCLLEWNYFFYATICCKNTNFFLISRSLRTKTLDLVCE